VDLQTRTATFQSGMSDAAKSANGAFKDIKKGAQDMAVETGHSMGEARHGIMLLGEEFGIHLPRGITSFLASLGPVAGIMEAAFPFLAIAVGATLLIEHLVKIHEEAEKAAESHVQFGIAANKAFEGLDDKLLRAGMEMDNLTGDHLGALKKELELIDHASLAELMSTFNIFDKAADATFAHLKASWYSIAAGSNGAKNALDDFKLQYEALLAQGKDKEASDLLAGTLQSAKESKKVMEQSASSMGMGGFNEKQLTAQTSLIDALNAQVTAEGKINALKQAQDNLATAKTDKTMGGEDDKKWKELAREAKQEADDAQKAWDEAYKAAVSKLQESEREKIEATEKGSKARLAAIDAAIKEEQSKGLQETGYYKSLLSERVNLTREMGEEEKRVKAESDREDAGFANKMDLLRLQAAEENALHALAMEQATDRERLAAALHFENEKYENQQQAYARDIAALDKTGRDYEVKLKQIQDRETELTQEHENKITAIKDQAAQQQQSKQQAAMQRMENGFAQGFLHVLEGHQSFASMMSTIGQQVVSSVIEQAIAEKTAGDSTKMSDAAHAARKMFIAGSNFPFPANIIAAPLLGATAFAAMMAFEQGGIVPGVGRGDTVPAMLTPGESVIPKRLTEQLSHAAQHGGGEGGSKTVHVHLHQTNHMSAIDGAGVESMLQNNAEQFTRHVHNELRKRNM
jgi:hypothetical protein